MLIFDAAFVLKSKWFWMLSGAISVGTLKQQEVYKVIKKNYATSANHNLNNGNYNKTNGLKILNSFSMERGKSPVF